MEKPLKRSPTVSPKILAKQVKALAKDLGFDVCGIAEAKPFPKQNYFFSWLEQGMAAGMEWLKRNPERRLNPRLVLPGTKRVVVLGTNYYQPQPGHRGKIATYALGKDYHDLLPKRVRQLSDQMNEWGGEQRCYTDTGPVMEKALSAMTSVGWQGKSTMLIHRKHGAWLFLSVILTTLELEFDEPEKDHCGNCTRCMDACPTDAITTNRPYQLDARRCIAYLTIEHKGIIPVEFRKAIGDHLFGCDDCLDVCPWNRWAQETREAGFKPIDRPDLRVMLHWDDATFRNAFRGTPVFRLKRDRWIRNLCVVLGNIGDQEDLWALREVLKREKNEVILDHATWAVDQLEKKFGLAPA
ncbi:MAG: tRNA epoxyqueuosine(34) reductase QueG [Verrucomicrobiota bacterium]